MANIFDRALAEEGVVGSLADLARSIFAQESSSGKNTKTSNAGAVGGMQIIPSTFNSVADKGWDINDPLHNARAGLRYIKQLNKLSGGVPELTAAGYYGGPGAIAKARRGIGVSDPRNPNAPNTLQYGAQVAARMGKAARPALRDKIMPVPATAAAPVTQALATPEVTAPLAMDAPAPVVAQPEPAQAQPPEWAEFQQALPAANPMASLASYGVGTVQPANYANMLEGLSRYAGKREVNFSNFSGFGPRA